MEVDGTLLTCLAVGKNCILKIVGIPGATFVAISAGLIILKYGESAWKTFTSLDTCQNKCNKNMGYTVSKRCNSNSVN